MLRNIFSIHLLLGLSSSSLGLKTSHGCQRLKLSGDLSVNNPINHAVHSSCQKAYNSTTAACIPVPGTPESLQTEGQQSWKAAELSQDRSWLVLTEIITPTQEELGTDREAWLCKRPPLPNFLQKNTFPFCYLEKLCIFITWFSIVE